MPGLKRHVDCMGSSYTVAALLRLFQPLSRAPVSRESGATPHASTFKGRLALLRFAGDLPMGGPYSLTKDRGGDSSRETREIGQTNHIARTISP